MVEAAQVLEAARKRGWQIATAESCTGGLIAAALTEVPGSSDVFDRGFVTYSNGAKQDMIGVTADALDSFGAVSEQVAQQMAQGARDASSAELAVSVTGIAGPGGSDVKPEGMVCFGVASPNGIYTQTVQFGALGRTAVRLATVDHAIKLLLDTLDS